MSLAACTTTPAAPRWTVGQQATVEGQVATVDTTPWTYDGSAVVKIASTNGQVDVHLPARWNLCKAPPPDEVQALERVTVSQPLPLGATLARAGEARQHVYTLTEGALRFASPWNTASMLLPSGSSTNAA